MVVNMKYGGFANVTNVILNHGFVGKPCKSTGTARPYGLPPRLEWTSNILPRRAQKPAQGQYFGIYETPNPKP